MHHICQRGGACERAAPGQIDDTEGVKSIGIVGRSVLAPEVGSASIIDGGDGFACALVGATVHCWGENGLGQLGI